MSSDYSAVLIPELGLIRYFYAVLKPSFDTQFWIQTEAEPSQFVDTNADFGLKAVGHKPTSRLS